MIHLFCIILLFGFSFLPIDGNLLNEIQAPSDSCILLHFSMDNFTIDGKAECGNTTVMNFITSASNEAGVQCFNPINLPLLMGVCLQLYNIRLNMDGTLSLCSRLEIAVVRKVVYDWKMGCLSMSGEGYTVSSRTNPTLPLNASLDTVHLNMTLAEARAESHHLRMDIED